MILKFAEALYAVIIPVLNFLIDTQHRQLALFGHPGHGRLEIYAHLQALQANINWLLQHLPASHVISKPPAGAR